MHQEFKSPEELRDAIKCFWYNSRDFGPELSGFEVIPDGYAEIIFHFGNGCSIVENSALKPLPSPFMVGLLNQPVTFYSKGQLEIIAVRCFPWAVFDLLEIPSGKAAILSFRHAIAKLQPILAEHIRLSEREDAINIIKEYFVAARSHVSAESMLFKAGEAMKKAGGTLPVSEVADAAHVTVRTLERNFKQSSGHTVKDVSALMRFEQVRNRLWTDPGLKLAGLAHELGYTDQSHLSREFKRYSGSSPAAFARNAKKGKQAISADFVAFVQS